MKKGLLIGGLSFVAGVLTYNHCLIKGMENKNNEIIFEDEKIKMTEVARFKTDNSRLAYIQMKDEK